MILSNLHTHTTFCDGKNTAEDFVQAAIGKGFTSIGFSCHSYFKYDTGACITLEKLVEYHRDLLVLKEKYADKIEIYIGRELDFESEPFDGYEYDFTIGAVHNVYFGGKFHCIDAGKEAFSKAIEAAQSKNNTIQNNTSQNNPAKNNIAQNNTSQNNISQNNTAQNNILQKKLSVNKTSFDNKEQEQVKAVVVEYYRNLTDFALGKKGIIPDIMAHFDIILMDGKHFFDPNANWYKELVCSAADVVIKNNIIIEINTGGLFRNYHDDLYPAQWLLDYMIQQGAVFTIGSDAHTIEGLDYYFNQTAALLKSKGVNTVKILRNEIFVDMPILL